MKLTLRTLIAFLDGTMDDNDAASFGKKIRESDSIMELVQRIRRVASQPQLPAPKTDNRSLGGDPNSSSEYIDNTLDLERVAEFEKLTIGSDILLAEIAEAHRILAKLSEIDEGISGRLRNRLYQSAQAIYKTTLSEPETFPVVEDHSSIEEDYEDIAVEPPVTSDFNLTAPSPNRPQAAASESDPLAPPVQPPPSEVPPVHLQTSKNPSADQEVTDQAADAPPILDADKDQANTGLDEKTSRRSRPAAKMFPVILATACVTALVVLIIVSFINRPNSSSAQNNQQLTADVADSADQPGSKQGEDNDAGDQLQERPDPDDENGDPASEPLESATSTAEQAKNNEQENADELVNPQELKESSTSKQATNATPEDTQKTESNSAKKKPEILNLFQDKDYGDGESAETKSNQPKTADDQAMAAGNPPGDKPEAEKRSVEDAPQRFTESKQLMAEAVKLANGKSVGVTKSVMQPTIRKASLPEAKWISVAQENPVFINDTIVSLPGCHSEIEIQQSVVLRLHDFSRIELKEADDQVLPLVVVGHGIVSFENIKAPNNSIDLSLAGKTVQATLVDEESQFCVVTFEPPPSSGLTPIHQIAATKGRLICKFGASVISLDPKEMIYLEKDVFKESSFKSEPEVLTTKENTLTTSAKEVFFSLSLENPVFELGVQKAKSDTRPYVRKFAAMAAFAMGDFDALPRFLNDAKNLSYFRDTVLFARFLVMSDLEFRTKLTTHCQSTAKQAAGGPSWSDPQLKQTWLKFLETTTEQQLQDGVAQQLVDELENQHLWMRVAAIQNLYALTGKTKFFRPEVEKQKSLKWLRAWSKALQQNEIHVSQPPKLPRFE